MGRMEKWLTELKNRPLLQAALAAAGFTVLWIAALLAYNWMHPSYTAKEITPALCKRILQETEKIDTEMYYIGKEEHTDTVYVGFTTSPYPDNATDPVILEFSSNPEKEGEYLYNGCRHNTFELARDVKLFIINRTRSIVINNNSRAYQLIERGSGKTYLQFDSEACPAMYILSPFYVYDREYICVNQEGESLSP